MEVFNSTKTLIFLILFVYILKIVKNALVFPRFSVLQITSAFSVPVELKYRKLFFDWGFQMNYDLPWNDSNFYNVPIWPGFPLTKRSIDLPTINYEKYLKHKLYENNTYIIQNQNDNINNLNKIHHNDLTAGELYSTIEDFLISYGYHETCLLKSVCENSRHPFDIPSGKEHLIAEVINFLLSPSIHDGFADDEEIYKKSYENAEYYGYAGNDCSILYPKCKQDLLNLITKVINS